VIIKLQWRFGRDNFNFHLVVLSYCSICGISVLIALHTESSSDTIRGALTEATLPVVIRRTCVKPSFLSASATNGCLAIPVCVAGVWNQRRGQGVIIRCQMVYLHVTYRHHVNTIMLEILRGFTMQHFSVIRDSQSLNQTVTYCRVKFCFLFILCSP